jgi:hypothetical protein
MHSDPKRSMEVVTRTVRGILTPMGFFKQSLSWRRRVGDVLQQFTIAYMQIEGLYRPEWGLNLWRLCGDARPRHYRLQVGWVLEDAVRMMPERLSYLTAFDMNDSMHESRRVTLVHRLFERQVVPCFDRFTTEKVIRRMVANHKTPHGATIFLGLPEDW